MSLWACGPVDQTSASRPILFVAVRPDHQGEEIYSIRPDGTEERRLTYSGEGKNSNIPQWSPDGTRIAFASNREDDNGRSSIFLMDPDGSNVQRLTPIGSSDYFPIWSPNGKQIVFMSSRDGNEEVYVMNSDGSDVLRLTNNEGFDTAYFWSLDGRQIVFTSDRDGVGTMYIMGSDGRDVRAIGPGFAGGWADSEDLVWYMDYPASIEKGVPCYGVMDLSGTVVEEWCGRKPNQGLRHFMCYSFDRTQMAFPDTPDGDLSFPITAEQLGKMELYVADADGSNLRRLTFNDTYEGHCSW